MLKTTGPSNKPIPSRNNGCGSASNRNNNSRPIYSKNNSNGEVDKFDISKNGVEHAKKSGKSKSKKTSKSWNLAKLKKKLSKSGNSTNFNTIKAGPKFLTPNARIAFNCLRLAFTEAFFLWYFDLECHIWIETDALGYAISGVLSQSTSRTNPDRVVTKTNLGQWHLIAFFSRKMIFIEIKYKIYNSKLLTIVKAFKTWRHHLKSGKHKILVFIN